MSAIIGRDKEVIVLNELYNSDKSEFVAVYGRRRVGKTFFVDEALKGRITFRHAGLSPLDEGGKKNTLKDQLRHFYFSLQMQGMKKSQNLLTEQLPKRSSVHHILITTFGVNYNEYSGIFQHVITIDQLF